jgi:probable phosphoglycerate mutase
MVRLWLARHGETAWNVVHRFQGWADIELTATGRAQANALGARLAGRRFDRVWSSDLGRAVETARLAVGEPTTDRRLREIDFGTLEGLVWDQLGEEVRLALRGFDGFQAPGGESMAAFKQRVLEFIAELGPGDHLVVTHGGVIRMLTRECGADGFPAPTELVGLDWDTRRVIV